MPSGVVDIRGPYGANHSRLAAVPTLPEYHAMARRHGAAHQGVAPRARQRNFNLHAEERMSKERFLCYWSAQLRAFRILFNIRRDGVRL